MQTSRNRTIRYEHKIKGGEGWEREGVGSRVNQLLLVCVVLL